jgi:hypothetical protein
MELKAREGVKKQLYKVTKLQAAKRIYYQNSKTPEYLFSSKIKLGEVYLAAFFMWARLHWLLHKERTPNMCLIFIL